jgi:hypothetical protein
MLKNKILVGSFLTALLFAGGIKLYLQSNPTSNKFISFVRQKFGEKPEEKQNIENINLLLEEVTKKEEEN